ncbi:hypothetical protein Dip518_000012 [Parelusimicrobium proximum]|uniref:hypothetical protein n=1 Tax=Parelusimicrobium proximum TaxID=3228953 RepID=UPI003D187446
MENISLAFQNSLHSQTPRYQKKILFYPRFFENGEEVWGEAADITEYVVEISPIKWKMDNEGYSVWNISTASITLSNINKSFVKGSKFYPSSALFYKSKIKILGGVNTAHGSDLVNIFEGYILSDIKYLPDDKTISLTLFDRMSAMDKVSAEAVSIINENIELVSEDRINFHPAVTAVGEIYYVRTGVNLEESKVLEEGRDYDVEDLASYSSHPVISLKYELPEDEKIWASVRIWYTDKTVEWLVEEAVNLAGIERYEIEEVVYANSVINIFEEGGGKPFSGTFSGTEVKDNKVILSESSIPAADLQWIIGTDSAGAVWTHYSAGIEADLSPSSSPYVLAYSQQNIAYGTWRFKVAMGNMSISQKYYFIAQGTELNSSLNGYYITVVKERNADYIRLYKVISGAESLVAQKATASTHATDIELQITRSTLGVFSLWSKPVTAGSVWTSHGIFAMENTVKTSNSQIAVFYLNTEVTTAKVVDIRAGANILTNTDDKVLSGYYMSGQIDSLIEAYPWEAFICRSTTYDGGSCELSCRHKETEDGEWSAWCAAPLSCVPLPSRFLQFKWSAVRSKEAESPSLDYLYIKWEGNSAEIAVANMRDLSCLDVVKYLALITTYEIGFDRSGKFFFKSRKNGSPVYDLTDKDIIDVESVCEGVDFVYNRIIAEFGEYRTVADSNSHGEERPNSIDKYGERAYIVSSSHFLPAESKDITSAIAATLYPYLSKSRRRAALTCRFLPQLSLGDIVRVFYKERSLNGRAEPFFNGNTMRIEGIETDMEKWRMRLDLTEVTDADEN